MKNPNNTNQPWFCVAEKQFCTESKWGDPGIPRKVLTPYETLFQLWRKAFAEQTNRLNFANRPVYAVSRLLPLDAIRIQELSSCYRLQVAQKRS